MSTRLLLPLIALLLTALHAGAQRNSLHSKLIRRTPPPRHSSLRSSLLNHTPPPRHNSRRPIVLHRTPPPRFNSPFSNLLHHTPPPRHSSLLSILMHHTPPPRHVKTQRTTQNPSTLSDLSLRVALTGDHCEQNDDCQSPRLCISEQTAEGDTPCDGQENCYCKPQAFKTCQLSNQCDNGEVCVQDTPSPYCLSENRATDGNFTHAGGALSLEDCTQDTDCEPTRICLFNDNGDIVRCDDRDGCFCRFIIPRECQSPVDCPFGETCVIIDETRNVCVSSAESGPFDIVEEWGLTMDPCVNSQGCQNELCRFSGSDGWEPCWGRDLCFCRGEELKDCETNDDCPVKGEVCSIAQGGNAKLCRSKRYVDTTSDVDEVGGGSSSPSPSSDAEAPTPTPTTASFSPGPVESGQPTPPASATPTPSSIPVSPSPTNAVCVDAQALSRFNKEDLVYDSHQLARVLCDKQGSCATPGHVVSFEGKSMMMKTYCALKGCVERTIMVNSPRYRRGLVVETKTQGLVFTTFAARYETRTEEMVLASLIRMGL